MQKVFRKLSSALCLEFKFIENNTVETDNKNLHAYMFGALAVDDLLCCGENTTASSE